MKFEFNKATKADSRIKLALEGVAGSGKTYTALQLATLIGAKKIALIDTEHGSASKYSDLFPFDQLTLKSFDPDTFSGAIRAAISEAYDVVIIDSLSHAWMGRDGALEQAGGRFDNWKNVTPKITRLMDTIVSAPCHVFATMRTKAEYVIDKDDRGKTRIEKVGTKAVMKDGADFEFDIVGDLDQDNVLRISKTRIPMLRGRTFAQPGEELAEILRGWLDGTTSGLNSPEDASEEAMRFALAAEAAHGDKDALRKVFADVKSSVSLDEHKRNELLLQIREAGTAVGE